MPTLPAWLTRIWRRPTPLPPRPDHAKIYRLERELGLTHERPLRPPRTVCLTKNCTGATDELRTWTGQLVMRLHTCESEESR